MQFQSNPEPFLARHLAITLDLHFRGGFWTHGENLSDEVRVGNDEFQQTDADLVLVQEATEFHASIQHVHQRLRTPQFFRRQSDSTVNSERRASFRANISSLDSRGAMLRSEDFRAIPGVADMLSSGASMISRPVIAILLVPRRRA